MRAHRLSFSLLIVLIVGASLAACSKPRRELKPASAPPGAPATTAPGAPAPAKGPAAPEQATPPAPILSAEIVDAYLRALEPIVAELRKTDARFAERFRGTAVPFAGLVDPAQADSRDGIARRNGYANWLEFEQIHERTAGCLAVIVSRTLRMMNVGANMNRIREMEKKLAEPNLHPDERAQTQAVLDQLRARNEEMRKNQASSPLIPEADIEVVGKRQSDLSAAFGRLRGPANKIEPITTPAPSTAPEGKGAAPGAEAPGGAAAPTPPPMAPAPGKPSR